MLKPFTCRSLEQNLAAYLAGELSAEQRAAFNAHLNTCAECAEKVYAARRLDTDLRAEFAAWQPRLPRLASAHIQAQVYVRMRAQVQWQRVWQFASNLMSVLVVAGLALAAWAVWQLSVEPLRRLPPAPPPAALWSAEQGNAQGTLLAETLGPRQPKLQWETHHWQGFAGGPAIDAAGTLYIIRKDGKLLAFAPNGEELWSAALPRRATGTPALSAAGVLYLSELHGGLMAFSTDGKLLWEFTEPKGGALSSPIVGPQGEIYYANMRYLLALTAQGQVRWRVPLPTDSYISPLPHLSADGRYLTFADTVVETATGQVVSAATPENFDAFVVGADGRIYLQQGTNFIAWEAGQPHRTLAPVDKAEQAAGLENFSPFPSMAGVLPDGRGWVYIFSENSRGMLWAEAEGTTRTQSGPIFELLGVFTAGRVVAVDQANVVFACKEFFAAPRSPATCYAHPYGAQTPLWQFPIYQRGEAVIGGALAQETLYLVTSGGYLLAVNDGPR